MKKLTTILVLSVIINICFITYAIRLLNGLGGVTYVKARYAGINTAPEYTDRYKIKTTIFKTTSHTKNEILFLGDSMTDYGPWSQLFSGKQISNGGIAGDNIQGVIDRISDATVSQPKKLFLMIGVNNISNHDSVNSVLNKYAKLIYLIKYQSPHTQLYVESILPTSGQGKAFNMEVIEINHGLSELSKQNNVLFINLYDSFLGAKNQLNAKYSVDGIHLNGEGYSLWASLIRNYI